MLRGGGQRLNLLVVNSFAYSGVDRYAEALVAVQKEEITSSRSRCFSAFLIFRGVDIGRRDCIGSSTSILSLCEDVDKSGLFDALFRLSLIICSEIAVGFSITTVSGDTLTS